MREAEARSIQLYLKLFLLLFYYTFAKKKKKKFIAQLSLKVWRHMSAVACG